MTFDEAVVSLNQLSDILTLQDPESHELVTIQFVIDRWHKDDVIKVAEHLKTNHPEIFPN